MGELRVNPRQPDKNDAGAALADYRHAVDLRRKIASLPSAQARDRRDLALSLSKMGDGHFWAGDTKLSVETHQSAWALAQTLVRAQRAQHSDLTVLRALGAIDERRCIILLAAGNNTGALDACREGIATLSPLAKAAPEDIDLQRLIASTQGSYANALRFSKQPLEAAAQAKLALESLRRLESMAPSNAEYRRLSSTAETILAASLAASGDNAASMEAFRRAVHSMEVAIEIDPSDLGSPLRLAVTLMAFSRRLAATGDNTGGHDTAAEALQLLNQTAQKPGAGPVEWNEYADALLKVDWPDLRQPAKALQLAQNAVSSTNRKNPFFMDTLAWALYRAGDAPKAAETEREALGLLPQDAKGGLHEELDRGLTTFMAGTPKKL
jgi:tetratricopeptide (TPR) repeat protein